MVDYFNQGGGFMWPILIALILGLAIGLAKMWALWRAGINTRRFIEKIRTALKEGGTEAALDICKSTRGPVASIFYAGLIRAKEGIEHVEKAITNSGSIEMAFLEKGMIWLGFIIVIAPMLGFTGTVWGMIVAFDAIKVKNDISPAVVAGGISQALLTTLFGLIVAMIVQLFYNWASARIDKLIIDMEEASVQLIDTLIELGN
ncbi:flagellar motor protein MotA [candidate division KSB1 bacterium 4484_188]|nr:MAG: flagellar motor protein MotA [candidate division KSB1 bacterium 4484_188]HFE65216.1 MotA/TolQ/ExbB proton channel family protein [Caldithrix sp.]